MQHQRRMTKSNALIEARPRKAARQSLPYRARAALDKHGDLPVKPLLVGVGIGAALLGTALAARSKRNPLAGVLAGANPALSSALTRTALVAIARVVGGQTVRSVASSALLEVANALKS